MFDSPLDITALALTAAAMVATSSSGGAQETPTDVRAGLSAPSRTGYVLANGVNYYYEIRGRGEPLLLLHGGLGSTGMFGPVLPLLAKERTVIGVDLQGHGRTALGDRPISLIAMADDMATLLGQLGYPRVDVFGYSVGGGVALRLK